MASEMIPTQGPSRSCRARKPTHTYSLTVDGDSFHLTAIASAPLYPTVARHNTPPPTPPSLDVLEYSPSMFSSSSRFGVPCLPVPRGPRSTNVYLYPPTTADYAKAQKRRVLHSAAIEEARKEREDDERRRNATLGIAAPRKSTRRRKAKVVVDVGDATVEVEHPVPITERKGRKGKRAVKPKPMAVGSQAAVRPVSIATTVSSTPFSFPSHSAEAASPAKKSRRKPQPKVYSRPTERLTTRSLARAKAISIACESEAGILSISPSEAGAGEAMDVDVKPHDEFASERSSTSSGARLQDHVQKLRHEVLHQVSTETAVPTALTFSETTHLETSDVDLSSHCRSASHRGRSNGPALLPVEGPHDHDSETNKTRTSLGTTTHSFTPGGSSGHGLRPLSQAHLLELDGEDTSSQRSSSGEVQSSDTLCDDIESVTRDVKEVIADGMALVDFFRAEHPTTIDALSLPPPSQPSASFASTSILQDYDTSPASTTVASLASIAPPTTKARKNKRKVDDIDMASKLPCHGESRRSSRIPKKRKLY